MSNPISRVHAREVIDSRGNPTIEVEVSLSDGALGRAMVPSGASKGRHEALELRDGDAKRFLGKGVQKAVQNVNGPINLLLAEKAFGDAHAFDAVLRELDTTPQKSKIGANAFLGTSLAFAHAVAVSERRPLFLVMNEWMGCKQSDLSLPVPLMNVLNGGMHADNGLEIQEFMVVPHGFSTFSEALRAGCEIFQTLKKRLHDQKLSTGVGDEGGFAPIVKGTEHAVELLCEAIRQAGYSLGDQVSLALDVAAGSFFANSRYKIRCQGKVEISSEELIELYADLTQKYPILSIEDGLEEDDWESWHKLTLRLGKYVQLVGDDLFVTQTERLQKGINQSVANAVLIKVNQVGSLSETFDTMVLANKSGYRNVVSHRSGETEDVTIAHLAVGSGCGQIKTGSLSRSERLAKYNELLRMEEWSREHRIDLPLARPFKK